MFHYGGLIVSGVVHDVVGVASRAGGDGVVCVVGVVSRAGGEGVYRGGLGDRARKNETVFDLFHVIRSVTSDVYNFSGIYFKMYHRHIIRIVFARSTTSVWHGTL